MQVDGAAPEMARQADGAAPEAAFEATFEATLMMQADGAAPEADNEADNDDEDEPLLTLVPGGEEGGNMQIPLSVGLMSATIKDLVCVDLDEEDGEADPQGLCGQPVPLPAVPLPTMQLVAEWMMWRHAHRLATDEEKAEYDRCYLDRLEDEPLFDLIHAANYLEIKDLLDAACQRVADMIKACDTPQDIRRRFNIVNDFTPEEEEQIAKEIEWVDGA